MGDHISAGATWFPELAAARVSSQTEIDAALERLDASKQRWVDCSMDERIALLEACLPRLEAAAERFVAVGRAQKRSDSELVTLEEWSVVSAIGRLINQLIGALRDIATVGQPRVASIRRNAVGHVVARTVPRSLTEKMTLLGITIDVWMAKHQDEPAVQATQARAYKDKGREGQVALVLAAGNAGHLPGVDALTKLYVELEVVVCKMNPVNAELGPLYEDVFAPLIEAGVLVFVYGGSETGAHLTGHPLVNTIALTGSKATFDAITFGVGPDAETRRQQSQPVTDKTITAELGNVTPLIIIPGDWSATELELQATQAATWQVLNSSYACLTHRVMVMHHQWPLREAFLAAYRRALEQMGTRFPYYPGTHERFEGFRQAYADKFEAIGHPGDGHLPWGLAAGVRPESDSDHGFQHETFCGVVAEVPLSSPSVDGFLAAASRFVNDKLWGTLVATVVVDPKTQRELGQRWENWLAELRFGTICINLFPGQAHLFAASPWGAAPGGTPTEPGSGIGFNNDPFMFGAPEKTIVQAPFTKLYDPVTNPNGQARFGRAMGTYFIKPSLRRLHRLALAMVRAIVGG